MELFALIAIAIAIAAGALIWFFLGTRTRRSRAEQREHSRPPLPPQDAAAQGPPPPAPAAPRAFDDNVQFTVYRPREIEPQRWYSLLAFVHLTGRRPEEPDAPDPIAEVARQAARLLEGEPAAYSPVVGDSVHAIPRSGELTLIPQMDGIEFNPAQCTFRWEQPVHRAEFRLRALAGSVPRTARGRLTIFWGSVIVGDVPLAMFVVANAEPAMSRASADTGRPYRNIFASYSHRDVNVVEEFDAVIETLGDRYLRDVRDLRAGQVWSDELERLIERADVFQLFWSWNALASPFVQKEWEFALRLQRSNFIRPVYWEEPLPERGNLPPETLRRLHFHRLRRGDTHQLTTLSSAPAPVSGPALAAPAKKPWFVRATPMLTAAAATILVATVAWPLLTTLRRPPPVYTELPSTGGSPKPSVPAQPDDPTPSPTPTMAQRPLAPVSLPRASLADGRRLAAGTYEIELAKVTNFTPSGMPSRRWVEFRRNGRVIGRHLATIVPASAVAALQADRPEAGQTRVSLSPDRRYMRVWVNDAGTYYEARLPLR